MKQFCVIYLAPHSGIDEWMKQSEEVRKTEEETMKHEWDAWMAEHAGVIKNTIGLGKPKRVTADGITDARNDLMLSSYVEAESLEAAAELFTDHPHFKIPGASIEVMQISQVPVV